MYRNKWVLSAIFSLSALIVPLWITDIPPLVDVPNHAARIYILANFDSSQFFQEMFAIVYEPIPNMALDILLVPIANTVGIWAAVRIFLTLTVLLFALGCFLISTANGERRSYSIIIAWFTIYGATLFYGFANYLFSVSVFMVTYGLWLRWRNNYSAMRLFALTVLASSIYLSHLSSYAFLWLGIVIVRLYDLEPEKNIRVRFRYYFFDALIFIPAGLAFLVYMDGSGNAGFYEWNSFKGKMTAFFGPFLSYDPLIDALVLVIVILFFATFLITKKIEVDRRLLTVAFVFLIIFALAPKAFITGDADARIVLPAMALAILSLRIEKLSKEMVVGFAIAILALIGRQGVIGYRFLEIDAILRNEIAVLEPIPRGSMVLALNGTPRFEPGYKLRRPVENIVQVVSILNGSITPTLFAIRGQNPLIFRHEPIYFSTQNEDPNKWIESLQYYDYIWTNNVPEPVLRDLGERAEKLSDNGRTKLWKLGKK